MARGRTEGGLHSAKSPSPWRLERVLKTDEAYFSAFAQIIYQSPFFGISLQSFLLEETASYFPKPLKFLKFAAERKSLFFPEFYDWRTIFQ